MLRLIPRPLHRLGYRLAHALRVRWWRLRRPEVRGCRVLALDDQGRILLIRHSYGSTRWMLPGGGYSRGEEALAAAKRELREETGCELIDGRVIGRIFEPLHGARNRLTLVRGWTNDVPCADGREVVAAEFFAPDSLPEPRADDLQRFLERWLKAD